MRDAIGINQATGSMAPSGADGYDLLCELALDLRSSWNHAADEIWRQLDAELWDLTHNPWVVLQTVSRQKVELSLADAFFRKSVDDLIEARREAMAAPTWFANTHPQSQLTCVAYFSMEFMLSEALPIYSGGLGNVAGDQLKAANDLGVPVVGVGLLYQQGYFRQVINPDGSQQAVFPYNDPGQLPITPLRQPDGEWLRLKLNLSGYPIWLRAWQAQVGRTKLYLLDSNDSANYAPYRGITSELYGGDSYLRLLQELVLGIGGWRLLGALGIEPDVCHLNEGHAAFAVLERARQFKETSGQPFDVALAATRVGNLFTTHTAVAAGFDRFAPSLIEQFLGGYARDELGLSMQDFLGLGRQNAHDPSEYFNMAYLAIRGSGAVNGVSRLHGEVSRRLFQPLFPRWPQHDVPIGHVTNGVHVPSWDSALADDLWTQACGKNRSRGPTNTYADGIRGVSDTHLWQFRNQSRATLVDYARERLSLQLATSGESPDAIEGAKHLFDPTTLTLGFARRFATYKRPDLLLHDPERLIRLLTNAERPVQLIMAGKAHPADKPGQDLIQAWVRFIRQDKVRAHIIFLSDYDMLLTERLVQGADVWLNTPRRPWEASGTSGMKVLVNGGINLSELDGWWAEAYSPAVGWALGDGQEHGDDPGWDAIDAEALYDLLEHEVIPEFYARDAGGIPRAWVTRMRESMAQLTPQFSTSRVVREYTETYYLPAAISCGARAANNGKIGAELVARRRLMDAGWDAMRFGEVKVQTDATHHVFEVRVDLDHIDPGLIRLELYAEGVGHGPPARQEMARVLKPGPATGNSFFKATVSADRPSTDYTARAMSNEVDLAIPLEDARIRWQR